MPATVLAERVGWSGLRPGFGRTWPGSGLSMPRLILLTGSLTIPGISAVRSLVPLGAVTRRRWHTQGVAGASNGLLASTVHQGPDDWGPAGRNVGADRISWRGSAAAELGQRDRYRPAEQPRRRGRSIRRGPGDQYRAGQSLRPGE